METYAFTHEMSVRDYECDIQGIVNNGVYQNYLEHVRHLYLKTIGIDFTAYARRGINLVVVRAELDYRHPLTCGDRFLVGLNLVRVTRLRFAFHQDIYRLPDKKTALNGKFTVTALNERGRPDLPPEIEAVLPRSAARGGTFPRPCGSRGPWPPSPATAI
jgi:acyl-CoA thioester hydrolase